MTTGTRSRTIACEGHDDAVEKIIEILRGELKDAKGYTLTFAINKPDGLMIGHSAGGEVSIGDLARLCMETLNFSKKVYSKNCNCDNSPCKAASASQTTH